MGRGVILLFALKKLMCRHGCRRVVGEITPHTAFITRPVAEVPENEQWRTARPVPATEYFDGLARELVALELLPVPFNPGLLVWEIWHAKGHREFQVFADVSFTILSPFLLLERSGGQ